MRPKRKQRPQAAPKQRPAPWSATRADAWIGLLETHKRLTREVDGELERAHGLSISSFELLTRLANAEDRRLRLTTLANEAGLSLSRVSRILDTLERRGLVERRPAPDDTRAKNAWLTSAGSQLQRSAEITFFAGVERLFFDRVTDDDLETLARVFGPFRRNLR
jgi:DNA-binding MarR family transcriptional regulator